MNAPDDFLSEIESAYHEHLLKAGNLGPKPRENSWTGENSWASLGIAAHIHGEECSHCEHITYRFLGYFETSTTPSGITKETRTNRPVRCNLPQKTTYSPAIACVNCYLEPSKA